MADRVLDRVGTGGPAAAGPAGPPSARPGRRAAEDRAESPGDESREAERHVFASLRLILLGVTAVVQPSLSLGPVLTQAAHPAARVAFTVTALVTLLSAVWVVRRRPIPLPVALGGAVTVLAACAVATGTLPPHAHFGPAHWSYGLIGWHLLLLLLDRVPLLLAAQAAHLVLGLAQWLLTGAPDRAEIGNAGVAVLSATSFQLGVLVMSRILLRSARQAAEDAAERERAATRAALAEQWEQDLRAGFAGQLGVTLPLLADLADGVLDPRAEDTRRRCALAATQLRRLFAENDDVPDPLVHEVTACVHVAERRGVAVSLAVSGAPVPVPTDVRRELTGPLAEALSAARERARVSLLRGEDEVRVAVVTDASGESGTDASGESGTDASGESGTDASGESDTDASGESDTDASGESDTDASGESDTDASGESDTDAGVRAGTAKGRVEVECGTYGRHTRMEVRWRTS
ncbi:MSCRAMM family adhesin SdrC [Saccharothrix sp. S26]|uniref:MSCRAMM family adhesin SdrC n=1 Tax=Saccharothrix sp. S26 TaxID=2907215 RepID=UPI001F3A1312|nr:MSCRAMM family adhesin SdrC [Saccharothrix sp. S26]MCE6996576.1 MSCRAMM family adhesin SdrC [Saccharothrix sp. S26]